MSTPREVRIFRNAQRKKRLVEALDPQKKIVGANELTDILKYLVLYAEHTWGHSASISSPANLLVKQLEMRKENYALQADLCAQSALDKIMHSVGEGDFTSRRPFEYIVINPSDKFRKVIAFLPIDFWEEYRFSDAFHVEDSLGDVYPVQKTKTLRGTVFALELGLQSQERNSMSAPLMYNPRIFSSISELLFAPFTNSSTIRIMLVP